MSFDKILLNAVLNRLYGGYKRGYKFNEFGITQKTGEISDYIRTKVKSL